MQEIPPNLHEAVAAFLATHAAQFAAFDTDQSHSLSPAEFGAAVQHIVQDTWTDIPRPIEYTSFFPSWIMVWYFCSIIVVLTRYVTPRMVRCACAPST